MPRYERVHRRERDALPRASVTLAATNGMAPAAAAKGVTKVASDNQDSERQHAFAPEGVRESPSDEREGVPVEERGEHPARLDLIPAEVLAIGMMAVLMLIYRRSTRRWPRLPVGEEPVASPSPLSLSPGLDRPAALPPLASRGAENSFGAPMLDENVSCPVPGALSARVRTIGAILTRHALWPHRRGVIAGVMTRPPEAARLDLPRPHDDPISTPAGDASDIIAPGGCGEDSRGPYFRSTVKIRSRSRPSQIAAPRYFPLCVVVTLRSHRERASR